MIKELLRDGFVLKSKGYYKHSIETFYKALENDNTSLELLLEIADAYFLMGETEHSISYLEQILDKNPSHIGALKLLKKIFISKNAFAQAEQTAKNIYSISKSTNDLVEILRLLNKQKRFQEVLALDIEKYSPDVLYELAYAKLFLNCPIEAEELINKALAENSDNSKYLLLKGKILFKQNQKENSAQILEKMPYDNSNSDFLNFLGIIKQYKKDYKFALNCFLEAAKNSPDIAEYYYNCASTYFKMDEIKLAKKYYNTAISLEPESPIYHFALANLYYSQQNYKRAMEELNSNLFEARLLKSIILYDTGYLAVAKKEFKKLKLEEPENSKIDEYLGEIQNKLKTN